MSAVTLALDFGGEATPVSPLDAPRLLLEQLRRRGVTVALEGDRLALDAPKGALSDLLPEVARFKPSLLELLEEERREAVADVRAKASRLRLERLEVALGIEGACRAVYATGRRLEREKPRFWRGLNASDRHELAVCVALLDLGDAPEGEEE